MLLYLVRHGETESNRKGLALGRADVPLNERGRRQAGQLGEALAGAGLAAVYSSPLQRAMDTAAAVAAFHGVPVQPVDALIELDIGELDGLDFGEVRRRYPGLLEQWASAEGPDIALFGSESLADVRDRAWEALESIGRLHEGGAACVVTHNFVILSLLTKALRVELAHFRRLRHGVAAITTLEIDGERVRVRRMNDRCHLEAG